MEKEHPPSEAPLPGASEPVISRDPSLGIRLHLLTVGPARQAVLLRALAEILAREERPDPSATIPTRE